ncbi:hypothetical protein [Halocynthiibacter namhaensis]|uniref:hypothetical protein n=1 Tax=Halocynthiibacter namhaensis TaxID=1290553 RepID=UPI000578E6D1|nr:hypothetical protein [Halocynthiibacter namhaensis]
MPGFEISIPAIAGKRQAVLSGPPMAGLRLNTDCVTLEENGELTSVQALGDLGANLTVEGGGPAVQMNPVGFHFSAGKYLRWQSDAVDWYGALVVADMTLLDDPVQTGFILKLSSATAGRFYLRYLHGGFVSGLGPGNTGGTFDQVNDYGTRQVLAFLVEPATEGMSAGSQFRLMNADGFETGGAGATAMTTLSLDDVQIGSNANMVLHDLALYPLSPDRTLPGTVEALWKQRLTNAPRVYAVGQTEMLPVNGQSLGLGPMATAAEKKFHNFADRRGVKMLSGLERLDGISAGVIGARDVGFNPAISATGMVPSKIAGNLMVGHPIAAALNKMRQPGSPAILTGFSGYAGERIDNMDADPTTGSNSLVIHDNNAHWLGQATSVIASQGQQAICRYTLMVQGQGDKDRSPGVWRDGIERFLVDHLAQLQSEIPGVSPKLVFSQANGDLNTGPETWHVKAEQLQYATDTGALMVPLYAYETDDVNAIHPDAAATLEFSEVFAWAISCDEMGGHWNIVKPVSTLLGNTLTLTFNLNADEGLVAHDPAKYGGEGIEDLGFEVDGASINATVISGSTVTLQCDAAPTAWRYAMQSQDLTGAVMPYPAHRGLLRTDVTRVGPLSGKTLFRWIPSIGTTPV